MSDHSARRRGSVPRELRVPLHPVEAAVEADAVDAARRLDRYVVRGPLFGLAMQTPVDGGAWRVVSAIANGCAQIARDTLNSRLWFQAKDDTDDREVRRELLAAVARLESEPVDDLTVGDTRYRVVRADEYAFLDDSGMETPRPTDPEPPKPDWSSDAKEPELDDGLVMDPAEPVTPMQAAEQLAMTDLQYRAERYPADVREDSARAARTHPDVLLLPTAFNVVERTESGWTPASGPFATPHAARKSLDFYLTWLLPRMRSFDDRQTAEYAAAAAEFRAAVRANELTVDGTTYQITRARRLIRWGPDGPEGPRPSDVDSHEPDRLHPPMDEDGNVLFES